MNRRTLLRLLALGGVGTATLPAWAGRLAEVGFAQATSVSRRAYHAWLPLAFSPHQNETVIAISELIIPRTDTPGAKAAGVNEFIDAVIADADAPERDRFLQGLDWIDRRSRELHATDFISAASDQQTAILTSISDATPGAPAAGA